MIIDAINGIKKKKKNVVDKRGRIIFRILTLLREILHAWTATFRCSFAGFRCAGENNSS